jgi:excinuclease ABC subunit A
VQGILQCPESITGQYLSGARTIPVPEKRRAGNGKKHHDRRRAQNNLRECRRSTFPLGKFVCVTGCPARASRR